MPGTLLVNALLNEFSTYPGEVQLSPVCAFTRSTSAIISHAGPQLIAQPRPLNWFSGSILQLAPVKLLFPDPYSLRVIAKLISTHYYCVITHCAPRAVRVLFLLESFSAFPRHWFAVRPECLGHFTDVIPAHSLAAERNSHLSRFRLFF